jgi:hypothetical protein
VSIAWKREQFPHARTSWTGMETSSGVSPQGFRLAQRNRAAFGSRSGVDGRRNLERVSRQRFRLLAESNGTSAVGVCDPSAGNPGNTVWMEAETGFRARVRTYVEVSVRGHAPPDERRETAPRLAPASRALRTKLRGGRSTAQRQTRTACTHDETLPCLREQRPKLRGWKSRLRALEPKPSHSRVPSCRNLQKPQSFSRRAHSF